MCMYLKNLKSSLMSLMESNESKNLKSLMSGIWKSSIKLVSSIKCHMSYMSLCFQVE